MQSFAPGGSFFPRGKDRVNARFDLVIHGGFYITPSPRAHVGVVKIIVCDLRIARHHHMFTVTLDRQPD